jgi:Transposase DDE domain
LAEPVERALSQVRAVIEPPFHIVKNRFHHKKLRYRGRKKNTAPLPTLFALGRRFSIAVVSCQASSSLVVHFPRVIVHRLARFSLLSEVGAMAAT